MNIHHTLVHAVTEYDRKQSTKPGYNMYALAHYIGRVQDRLLDACLKAVGEPKFTKEEMRGQSLTYSR